MSDEHDRPARDEFARLVLSRIQDAGETATVEYDADDFRLIRTDDSGRFHLENAYREYCDAPEELRSTVLTNYVRSWFATRRELPAEFEDARHDLIPIVRGRAHFELIPLSLEVEQGKRPVWPYQPLGEHLGVGLAYDLPESMTQIVQAHLDDWGITLYEAFEAARENLIEISREGQFLVPAEGLYISQYGDSYDCSRVLLPEIFEQMELKGDPVAMIPNRGVLMVTGADDVAGLTVMAQLASNMFEQSPRPQTGMAIRYNGTEWVPFLPDDEHPATAKLRELGIHSMLQDYAQQKQLLDALHEKTNQDVFVASYTAVQKKDSGGFFSYCVWGDGIVSLLPRTDKIAFVSGLGEERTEPLMVEWNPALGVIGDLITPLDLYPERYRVERFPTEAELGRLTALNTFT